MGLEVLDNLPHDKIRARTRKRIEQAEIRRKGNEKKNDFEEIFTPLTDPLLQMLVRKVPAYLQPYPFWVPSVACGVLHHVISQRSNLALVMADFDWLPPPDLDPNKALLQKTEIAEGEPIVTDMNGNDHECYLTAPRHCDILFPTNFELLASFARKSQGSSSKRWVVRVDKQAGFLLKWGQEHVEKTQVWSLSGKFSPLLHDFVNCSVLTISCL
jgi:hypothetical protein